MVGSGPALWRLAESTSADPTGAYNHINCVVNAAAFFNNVRTPATLLVIPAFNSLWVDLSSTTRRVKHPVAQTLYAMACMLTVLVSSVIASVSCAFC